MLCPKKSELYRNPYNTKFVRELARLADLSTLNFFLSKLPIATVLWPVLKTSSLGSPVANFWVDAQSDQRTANLGSQIATFGTLLPPSDETKVLVALVLKQINFTLLWTMTAHDGSFRSCGTLITKLPTLAVLRPLFWGKSCCHRTVIWSLFINSEKWPQNCQGLQFCEQSSEFHNSN